MIGSFDSSLRGSGWEIVHIPGEIRPSLDKQPIVNVITSTIEPRKANSLIRQLNHISPLENLPHVKRIRKKSIEGGECQLSIILCLAPENGDIDAIPEAVKNLITSFQLSTSVAKVCKNAAISKEEWEAQCMLWPTSYHPPKYNIGGITGFSTEESDMVFRFMKYAIDLAISRDSLVVNAAVIVDPSSNEVIASACDRVYSKHPKTIDGNAKTGNNCIAGQCQHSPDLAEDGMATCLQCNCSLPDLKNRRSSVSCLYPLQWTEDASFRVNTHPLRHAAIVAIELSAARDRELFPNFEGSGDGSRKVDSSPRMESSQIKRLKTDTNSVDNCKCDGGPRQYSFDKPYLCTGYDVYLAWEPCTMCAMALVHQRLRRIFFAFPNSRSGALGGFNRLHGQKSLNHHYAVFRVLIPGDLYCEYISLPS